MDIHRPPFSLYPSRRSVVHSTNGIVACSQPLAAQAGINILRKGGNAADAAIAVAACLNVTEPTSTGIGGDVFCLFYSAKTRTIRGFNGSGRSPRSLTLEKVLADVGTNQPRIPLSHIHAVTVPGAAAAWCDVVETFGSGKLSMGEILEDAIRLAEEGYPVSHFASIWWQEEEKHLKVSSPNFGEMLLNGERAPLQGELMKIPYFGRTLRELAEKGKKGFYEGWVAEAIVEAVKQRGGVLSMEDLRKHGEHGTEEVTPVCIEYGGYKLWECAPNGQGLVALMTLGILESLQKKGVIPPIGTEGGYKHNSMEYIHALIESFRISFADARWWVTDPSAERVPTAGLINKEYLGTRADLFSPEKTNTSINPGSPAFQSCDTVYFSVTDKDGNGCSFVNSMAGGFGSGVIPKNTGFALQNRGSGFSLSPDHPNRFAPNKRPYHTILSAMITTNDPSCTEPVGEKEGDGVQLKGERLHTIFGCMGGLMQPQGHVQIFLNMLAFGMGPQDALDAPRVSLGRPGKPDAAVVSCEDGISEEAIEGLKKLGHEVFVVKEYERTIFGRGQVIKLNYDATGIGRTIYSAGSDLRGDCQAVGY